MKEVKRLKGGIDRPMPRVEGWIPAPNEQFRLTGKTPEEPKPQEAGKDSVREVAELNSALAGPAPTKMG